MDKRVSNLKQIASLTRYTITEGSGKGLDIIDCNNGKIRFLLNVTKALDILQLYHLGSNISFISKNGYQSREISYLNRFEGGMLYTCGLDSVGDRKGYEIHGSLHNTIATVTKAECTDKEIIVEAFLEKTQLFGENLLFKRRVYSAVNSNSVEITDTLINNGYKASIYSLLYHVNLGYPMLDSGVKIIADITELVPRTKWANENLKTWNLIEDPKDNQEETCYYLNCRNLEVSVINEKLGKQFTLKWSKDTLPKFIEWKSMASGDYALGLEPTTTHLDSDFEYEIINPNQEVTFNISLEVKEI